MAFDRWREATSDPDDLNLIPVMNLFMVLIPFLLMGAAFYHIGVIPTSMPVNDPQQSDVPKTPTTVAVNLEVTEDALKLTVASVSLDPETLQSLGAQWSRKKSGAYPVDALQKHLIGLKQKYPESNTITILPYEGLDYQRLVQILDKTRERKVGMDAKGEPKFKELFPVTIFSRLLTLPEEGAEEEGMSFEEGVE